MRQAGSPPHTWRIPGADIKATAGVGITSTYVENTDLEDKVYGDRKDHLHIRGEYLINHFYFSFVSGSPPHTWRIL